MIQEIRSYFNSVVAEVNPDIKPHNEFFTSENIADSIIEDRFMLKFGTFNSSRIDTNFEGTFDITLEIWRNGFRDNIDNLDNAYCEAIEIMSKAQNLNKITQDEFIKAVNGVSLIPESVEDNDNMGKFTIQFIVQVAYNSN